MTEVWWDSLHVTSSGVIGHINPVKIQAHLCVCVCVCIMCVCVCVLGGGGGGVTECSEENKTKKHAV